MIQRLINWGLRFYQSMFSEKHTFELFLMRFLWCMGAIETCDWENFICAKFECLNDLNKISLVYGHHWDPVCLMTLCWESGHIWCCVIKLFVIGILWCIGAIESLWSVFGLELCFKWNPLVYGRHWDPFSVWTLSVWKRIGWG